VTGFLTLRSNFSTAREVGIVHVILASNQPIVTVLSLSELITEALPDEGWELTAGPPLGNPNFEKDLPSLKGGSSRHDVGSPASPPSSYPPLSGGKQA
jgi:hypothetical protein